MKINNYIHILLLAIPLLTGCRKKEEGFEMGYRRQFDIPVGLDIRASHNYSFLNVPSDTAVFFQINNKKASDIKRILPRSMSLQSIFSSANSYDFISQAEVWISDRSRPKLDSQIIFFRDRIPANSDSRIDLVPNDVDLRPFLLEGNRFTVRINIVLRDYPPRTIETDCSFSFFAVTNE